MTMFLVTGCAGFIGSHIAERLLSEGSGVVGIDRFSDYYPRKLKEQNMEGFKKNDNFKLIEGDITKIDLGNALEGVDAVLHQAGQGGVRASWGKEFEVYLKDNVLSTQLLLEACKEKGIRRFVYASSSSIYGDADSLPSKETMPPKPVSPYGVSKLMGENLCYLYSKNFNIQTIALRYFTVFGPRQRPDEAFNKFIRSILAGEGISVFGSGKQTRDFTYVSDVVDANLLACKSGKSGEVYNIGGGGRIAVNDTIGMIEEILGKKAWVKHEDTQRGDVKHTAADITKARKALGYIPKVKIREGLEKEAEWIKGNS